MTARPNDRLDATEFHAMAADGPFAIYSGATAAAARTLWQVLETTTEAFPSAIAIDDGQSALSYRDLLSEARQAGFRLAARGIGAGDRIGIRMTSGRTRLYVSILAVLSVGAAYVPAGLDDLDDLDDRAELVWSTAGVRAIIGDGGELTWRTGRHRRSPARRPGPGDDAWIIVTSGTSGPPRGVAVTHGNAAAFVGAEASPFLRGSPLGSGDRVLAARAAAVGAPCVQMWLAWRHGACLFPGGRANQTNTDRVPAGQAGITAAVTGPPSAADRVAAASPAGSRPGSRRPASPPAPEDRSEAGTAAYVACGALQLLAFLAAVFAGAAVVCGGLGWLRGSAGLADLYLRSLAVGAGAFATACGLPIAAKWTLVGRWKPRAIPLWSPAYLRFWLVKTLVAASPLALFTGSPVYSLYLRALGAKVGRRVVIFSRTVPVCTDLLAIGDDTVIGKESSFTGYRAVGGVIQTGPISIGRAALIGEHTVLDIGTSVGDGSRLGRAPDLPYGRLRRTAHGSLRLLILLCVTLPLTLAAAAAGLTKVPAVVSLAASGPGGLTKASFYAEGLVLSTVAFFGALLLGGLVLAAVPRLRAGTGLRAKSRPDIETMGLFLAVRWVDAFVITVFCMGALELSRGNPVVVLAGLTVATLLFNLGLFVTVERALLRFGSLRPRCCPVDDPYVWWHERYCKLAAPLIGMFNGTPFKGLIWRLLGVRVGRRLFDDGCGIADRTLVSIGAHCTLNAGSVIQCHSVKDGVFESDYTVLEDGCTVGTGAFVHYGVTMGEGSQLRPGSFLMKGEKVPLGGRRPGRDGRGLPRAPLVTGLPVNFSYSVDFSPEVKKRRSQCLLFTGREMFTG
jgi:acetyltransferase-like isoleucine patch superfamily enzyme